ncbi:MAG: M1 family aminopeptidase [Bacteroidota bacterium]
MFKQFFLFELRYRLQRPMIYIFFLISLLLLFGEVASDNVQLGATNDAINVNAPYSIMSTILMMTLVGIFMTTALMNTAILRDFDYQFDELIFSSPITKAGYLGGRFMGAFVMSLLPFLGAFLGIWLGTLSPWVEASEVGAFNGMAYWHTFLLAVLPNIFMVSSIVFMLAALFRSSLFSFIGAIGILIAYLTTISFANNLDNEYLAIIGDPLAINAHEVITKYWTIDEKNTQVIALSGPLLINRILWVSLSLGLLVITYFQFSFERRPSFFKRKSKTQNKPQLAYTQFLPSKLQALPQVQISDSLSTSWQQFFHQTKMEFLGIVKSTPFIVLLVFGLINMGSSIPSVDELYGTGNHPVTYLVVQAIRSSLYLFIISILMYYSGVVIWRERDYKMDALFDASPYANWIPYLSKLSALIGMTALILCVAIACGAAFQTLSGYTHYEWSIYFREFLVYDMITFTSMTILAMVVQTLVNNKYLGYFTFILLLILFQFGPSALEIKSNLLSYANKPTYIYSDMNGWSVFAKGLAWFQTYWLLFASLLGLTSILFWVRGKALTWKQRWQIAKGRFKGQLALVMLGLGFIWMGTAGFLVYQTQILNSIPSDRILKERRIAYEQKYKQYEQIAQPRITAVDYHIDIYPEDRHFQIAAKTTCINKTKNKIKQIHFTLPDDIKVQIAIPHAQLELDDRELGYQIYQLDQALPPGDSIALVITSSYQSQGIENEVSNTDIIDNGTFLSNYKMIPVIGYDAGRELRDQKQRNAKDLSYRPRAAKLHANCSHSCQNPYISSDADWVKVGSTISTSLDQIAIAPGSLMREWTDGGRRYFRYELKKPVLNFYSFISGRYEIARDLWTSPNGQEVEVEIYYHKGHEYNVDKMIASVKRSLSYCSDNFLPYPHEQARIIEFPRYANFAQAFPGTMPYSESLGFIANLNEADAIDMVCYIVAHEMAHQWWAHQVIGANVQGATMLSETFAQYSALMIMQQTYGKDKMKQFMRYEMDKYLRGRSKESLKEMPLMYNEQQGYIHYRKGSVVMYALQDYIGEDSLNSALRRFAEQVAYQEPPYTTTLEFMPFLEAVTPDSLQYLLDDMFKNIILYSNKTQSASYRPMGNGQYEVQLEVAVEKYQADALGRESLIPHQDYIDIGIYSQEKEEGHRYGRAILVERHRIHSPDTSFTFIVDELPYEAGIDPNYLLVDRLPEDNVKKLDLEQ